MIMIASTIDNIPTFDDNGLLHVVVESPAGCRNKYKYDPVLRQFKLDKVLPAGAAFPYDFGFAPGTLGEDGDPLDVLVLTKEPTFTGCLVTVRLLGVIEAKQTEDGDTERNDRLIGTVETKRNPAEQKSLEDLPASLVEEIEHFFISYNRHEGRKFKPIARHGAGAAEKLVRTGMRECARNGNGIAGKSRGRSTAGGRKT